MEIDLNIFTNCHNTAPSTKLVEETYESFCKTFGVMTPVIWCDSHPRKEVYADYRDNLLKLFPVVRQCKSLSHGYLKSIEHSKADYIFQLEGDWFFKKKYITHTLEEICEAMKALSLYHFRFNKRRNIERIWDTSLKECSIDNLHFCLSPNISNNPHIIDRQKYINEIIQYIEIRPGSKGIEERLNRQGKYFSCVYGKRNYVATIKHIDGRRSQCI